MQAGGSGRFSASLHGPGCKEDEPRWKKDGQAANCGRVCISVGVFFIKMLWEEVTSPASVFVVPELEARALCQGEWEGILAGRAFRGLPRVCGHRPWLRSRSFGRGFWAGWV